MLALAAMQGRTSLAAEALAPLRCRLERPEPRVALGIALRGTASAMLDVSDGLTGDLGHILDASAVGARVDFARIPCAPALAARRGGAERELALACLLAGGDDYELLFTTRNPMRERVAAIAHETGVPLTRIGKVTPREAGLVVRGEGGRPLPALPRAFDHFAARA
jgi:thiamine-monophosphate kinase